MDIAQLEQVFRSVWIRETSAFPEEWAPTNPAYGQCFPTAWIARYYLGGTVVQGILSQPTVIHFWNVLPSGEEFDFTASQFQGDIPPWNQARCGELCSDLFAAYCTVFPNVAVRFRLFAHRFAAHLK